MMPSKVSGSPHELPAIWLLAALLMAAVAACADADSHGAGSGAHGLGVYVPAEWQTARKASGHQVHVVDKQIACTKCHELTGDSIGSVTPERCGACHEKQARIEHAAKQAQKRFGAAARADCTTCHAFTLEGTGHEPAVSTGTELEAPLGHAAGDCKRCHAQRQGAIPAVEVHGTNECLRCHRPHEHDKPQSAPCPTCHSDVTTSHAAQGKSPSAACSLCHQHQHAPAAEARGGCAACHATQSPIVPKTATFAEGHSECVGCHRPHQFEKAKAVACRSCHEDVHVLGAQRVREHAECKSCHTPHDVSGSPERACAKCHADKHPDHPRRGVAGTCVGCHDPHPTNARLDARAQRCSSCHQVAASDKDFHGGTDCKKCHQPHDFVRTLAEKPACTDCHAKQVGLVRAVSGHQGCQGCHAGLPHRPKALAVGCDSCHARQHGEVKAGHAQCTSCHEPHGGAFSTSCKSCHTAEHQSAPAGHKECVKCHQPHSGSTAKVRCASCHAAEAKTAHGQRVPSCQSCHRAHGPAGVARPPACTSCHQKSALSGLHAEAKHQECQRCHTGHGEAAPGSERATCLGCHTERKNHFPDAPRCINCHLFRKTR
jgi:hypothetical protein